MGEWELTTCPEHVLGGGVMELVSLADLFERGLPPVAGGTLDQAAWFVEAAEFWRSEQYQAMRAAQEKTRRA